MAGASRFMSFFASRRRHTRLQGDWSSDVCSSDLVERRHAPCPLDDAGAVEQEEIERDEHDRGRQDGPAAGGDRKSVVEGKSVDLGGRRIIKKKYDHKYRPGYTTTETSLRCT